MSIEPVSVLPATPMGVTVRRLEPGEGSMLREMLAVFAEAFGEGDAYLAAIPKDDYLARLLAKPHIVAIAGLVGDRVVGGIVAYVLDKFEQDRREVYIYDLAVAEAYRRRGIARAMIAELQQVASALDAFVIFVQADIEDAPAIELYRSIGRQMTAYHFDIDVPGRGAL